MQALPKMNRLTTRIEKEGRSHAAIIDKICEMGTPLWEAGGIVSEELRTTPVNAAHEGERVDSTRFLRSVLQEFALVGSGKGQT